MENIIAKNHDLEQALKKIMGHKCILVVTHNHSLEKKQRHSLDNGIVKVKEKT